MFDSVSLVKMKQCKVIQRTNMQESARWYEGKRKQEGKSGNVEKIRSERTSGLPGIRSLAIGYKFVRLIKGNIKVNG